MTEEEIQALNETNSKLVERVGFLEKDLAKAILKRDEATTALKDSSADESLKAENDNLLKQIQGQDERLEELTTTHKSEMNTMKMVSMFDELGIEADSKKAKDLLMPLLMDGADFEGDFRYTTEDKTTVFKSDNVKYGLIDKVNDLKEEGYGGLFKPETGGGAGDSKPPTKTKSQMTDDERAKDMALRASGMA